MTLNFKLVFLQKASDDDDDDTTVESRAFTSNTFIKRKRSTKMGFQENLRKFDNHSSVSKEFRVSVL